MKKLSAILLFSVMGLSLTGCFGWANSPTVGPLLTLDTKGPVATNGSVSGARTGMSEAYQVLGVSWGDASIETAAKNGNITKINNVTSKSLNILGVFSRYTLIVTGD